MRPSRSELLFVALGAALGAVVAWTVRAGLIAPDGALPPFVIVLFGLGIVELLVGFATGRPPGSLVSMPVRFLAFAVGVCILLLAGKLA